MLPRIPSFGLLGLDPRPSDEAGILAHFASDVITESGATLLLVIYEINELHGYIARVPLYKTKRVLRVSTFMFTKQPFVSDRRKKIPITGSQHLC